MGVQGVNGYRNGMTNMNYSYHISIFVCVLFSHGFGLCVKKLNERQIQEMV